MSGRSKKERADRANLALARVIWWQMMDGHFGDSGDPEHDIALKAVVRHLKAAKKTTADL